jgi:hypothetical protein
MNRFSIIAKYPEKAESVELDINEDFSMSFNYQIEDILDISSRNTSYSKTVTLPGTPNNNIFFRNVFDVNIDNSISFNPSKRIAVTVRVDDNEIFLGVMQLLNIISLQDQLEYEVTLFGKLKDILTTLDDASIKDLDLSEYDHIRNLDNVVNSTDYIVKVWGQDVDFNEPGNGYVYPYIIQNQQMIDESIVFYSEPTSSNFLITDAWITYWSVPYAFPAVYLKTIMDKVFQFAGYTYTSNFFNSDYFKKLIIPFGSDKIQLNEQEVADRYMAAGIKSNTPEFDGGNVTGYRAITGQITRGSSWWYNSAFSYFMPLNLDPIGLGLDPEVTIGNTTFRDRLNQWGEYGGFTASNDGFYDIDMDLKLVPKWIEQSGLDFRYQGDGILTYYYKIRKITQSGTITDLYSSEVPLTFSPSDNAWHQSPWYDTNGALVMNGSAQGVWLNAGDKIVIFFAVRYPETGNTWDVDGVLFDNDRVRLRMVIKQSLDGSESYFKVEPSSNQSYGNELIKLNEILPNIKMKDLFLDIVKMFNLAINDNKFKDNDLIIEPRDDFFASKSKVLDWEGELKLDYDSEIKITPMSELDAKTYHYTYTEDNDFLNEEYTNETRSVWGELTIDVENDFSQNTNTTKLLFSPTPIKYVPTANANINAAAPRFVTWDGEQFKPKAVKPRILFYNKLEFNDYNWIKIWNTINNDGDSRILTYWPYCGMWDHPSQPTYDLGFGKTEKIYHTTNSIPFNTLYEKFHKATLNNIIDKNSRLLEARFYLTPKDIATFDFRDVVFLLGSYWRVNKIKDYNPAGSDSLTTVILYKIVDVKTYDPDNVEIPTSNDKCPTDVVAIKNKRGGYTYISQSGQELNQDCCKQIGGRWIDGECKARRVIGLDPLSPIRYVKGGPGVFPIEEPNGPLVLQSDQNTNPGSAVIRGKQNFIEPGSGPSLVIGDNNTVLRGSDNSIIIGDGITATESDTIYLGDVKITPDGYIIPNKYYIIDGGEDEVMELTKINLIDIIDGTEDAIRNYGGDSKERPIIDGDITYNLPDTPEEY